MHRARLDNAVTVRWQQSAHGATNLIDRRGGEERVALRARSCIQPKLEKCIVALFERTNLAHEIHHASFQSATPISHRKAQMDEPQFWDSVSHRKKQYTAAELSNSDSPAKMREGTRMRSYRFAAQMTQVFMSDRQPPSAHLQPLGRRARLGVKRSLQHEML
jgi:hypothetical protein